MTPPDPPLYVEVAGAGPGLVLAHGFGGSARNFRPQARWLGERFRVVTYDARGHARSRPLPGGAEPSLDTLVEDMLTALDLAGVDGPVVAGGLSLGAATALRLAMRHPERVRALALASYPASRERPGSVGSSAPDFAGAIERDGLEAAGARFVWGPDSGLDERGAALVRQGFLEHDPASLALLLRGVVARLPAPGALAGDLAGVRVPVLIVSGGADAGSVESGEALAGLLPDARHEVLPGAGHVVNLAARAAFDGLLGDWLDRLPAARPIPS